MVATRPLISATSRLINKLSGDSYVQQTYLSTRPIFYVIEHVASGKKYAGCRYAKGCNPAEFMTEDGYCTSSTTINKIIEEEGLDAFSIIEIKTIDEIGNVYDYETKFLVENDCAKSDLWFNQHNNTRAAFGSEEFKTAMLAKHGVENASQSEEAKEQKRKTCLKNHGVENPFQSEEIREKSKQTILKNYGVENASQSEEVKEQKRKTCLKNHGVEYSGQSKEVQEKSRQTCLKNHGVEYAMQSEEVREKSRQTMLKNHDVEHALQSEEFKEKSRLTCLDRYGHENPMQSKEVREKHRQVMLKNHGVENPFQSEEIREKSKQTILKNYGVENASQSEEVKEQKRKTCLKNHGVEYSLQSEEVREKGRQTMLAKHGVENYAQTKEHRERTIKLHFERFNSRVKTEILNGDFSRFVYLYDTTEHVFLMGVEKSLNRGLETKRYIRITTNRSGFKKYIDTKTRKTYQIDVSKFSIPLPDNFLGLFRWIDCINNYDL